MITAIPNEFPLFIVRLPILNALTPSMVSQVPNQNPYWYTFAFGMVSSIPSSNSKCVAYHHMWSSPPLCHQHLRCTNLAHNTSLEPKVSTLGCHSISQNQTRAFNLPLFGNWWQPFTKIGFSIKVCELPLLVQAFKSKDMIWTNNTSSVW